MEKQNKQKKSQVNWNKFCWYNKKKKKKVLWRRIKSHEGESVLSGLTYKLN